LLSHAKSLKVMSTAINSSSRVSRLRLMATASLDVALVRLRLTSGDAVVKWKFASITK